MHRRAAVSLAPVGLALVAQSVLSGQEDPASAATVLSGVTSRASAIQSLTGTALVAATYSARRVEERSDRLMQDAIEHDREPLPADPVHASLLDFSFALREGRWRCEMLDLTNSGWPGWPGSDGAVRDRSRPYHWSYRISVSDGAKVYSYIRDVRVGYIRDYVGPQGRATAEPIAEMDLCVARGYAGAMVKWLAHDGFAASDGGQAELEGIRCSEVILSGSREGAGLWARAWVAPGLGFATLRYEEVEYRLRVEEGEKPALYRARVYTAGDFAEVTDGFWCPMTAQTDWYYYTNGDGADAWDHSRTIQCLTLEANTGTQGIVTPYPFPFDTRIEDESGQVLRDEPRHHGLAQPVPDAFGMTLTPESVPELPGAP